MSVVLDVSVVPVGGYALRQVGDNDWRAAVALPVVFAREAQTLGRPRAFRVSVGCVVGVVESVLVRMCLALSVSPQECHPAPK